jgi:FkbM family methyltransferase
VSPKSAAVERAVSRVRNLRLMLKTMRWLTNGREVWTEYRRGRTIPPLQFRSGLVLHHGEGDAPVFLLLEIFANGCYGRGGRVARGHVTDIGANIGAFALYCAWQRPDVRVHAFEPNPRAYETLRYNVHENHLEAVITRHNVAVAGRASELRLALNGPSLVASAYTPVQDGATPSTRMVPAISLADALSCADADAELLKIDAEGAEVSILEEASADTLRRARHVAVECHDRLVPGALTRSRRALETAGFHCRARCDRRCGSMLYARRQP